jgi:hypothetical protein
VTSGRVAGLGVGVTGDAAPGFGIVAGPPPGVGGVVLVRTRGPAGDVGAAPATDAGTTFTGGAVDVELGDDRGASTVAGSAGRPGSLDSVASRSLNGTGAGGGAIRATEGRLRVAAGGCAAGGAALPAAAGAPAPSTLARTGAIAATAVTGAVLAMSRATGAADLTTGRDSANCAAAIAVTAPR